MEITDAVVAFARACLTQNYRIVSAAHPTLAPLLLYVAAEFPPVAEPRVVIYQSKLFEDVLPTATRRFEAEGIGSVVWTEAASNDEPKPGRWDSSLRIMRQRMLDETDPVGAAFIGGMQGIADEFALFRQEFPRRPVYAVRRPGGEAALLSSQLNSEQSRAMSYPTIWRQFLRALDA